MSAEVVFVISYGMAILMKIVIFILGYLTIRLGYKLIDSGVKGEFKFSAKLGGLSTDLASLSPGLLFVLLGVMLIGYAVYVDKPVNVSGRTTQASKSLEPPDVEVQLETPNFEVQVDGNTDK